MRVIINAILILFVMYILLETCKTNKEIDFHMETPENEMDNGSNEYTLEPMSNNVDEMEEYQNFMDDYVVGKVRAGNFYETDDNSPNFKSNLDDPAKFYHEEDVNELRDLAKALTGKADEPNPSKQFNAPAEPKLTDPQMWNYKDESMMNGGQIINGVIGYDNDEDVFASFNCNPMTQKVSTGDLRFGKPIKPQ